MTESMNNFSSNRRSESYNAWSTLVNDKIGDSVAEEELTTSELSPEQLEQNWHQAAQGAARMLQQLRSYKTDTGELEAFVRSVDIMRPLLDHGVMLDQALRAKILYDEHYYGDGAVYDIPSDSQAYVEDVVTSIPILARYYSDDDDANLMNAIIEKRLVNDFSLNKNEREWLEGYNDNIARRILHGNIDLSAERMDDIIGGLVDRLGSIDEYDKELANMDSQYVQGIKDLRISELFKIAIKAGEDFADSEDPAVAERFINIQQKIREAVNTEENYQALVRNTIKDPESTDMGYYTKDVILAYAAPERIVFDWKFNSQDSSKIPPLQQAGVTEEEIIQTIPLKLRKQYAGSFHELGEPEDIEEA